MQRDTRILLIGFGNIGQALVRGWLAVGYSAPNVTVIDFDERARASAAKLGISARSAPSATAAFDVAVLAVKPNQLATVLPACRALVSPERVFLSVVAGKTIDRLQAELGASASVVRAMPNTPAAIGQAMTVLAASAAVTATQRAVCTNLLSAVGEVAWVEDEAQLDAVTAVSGSGPAYVFLLIECLEQAALELGLPAALAKQLAVTTVAGAGAYARAADEDAAELRRRVTSPGGTTEAALRILRAEPGMADLLIRAIGAAAARSRELSAA